MSYLDIFLDFSVEKRLNTRLELKKSQTEIKFLPLYNRDLGKMVILSYLKWSPLVVMFFLCHSLTVTVKCFYLLSKNNWVKRSSTCLKHWINQNINVSSHGYLHQTIIKRIKRQWHLTKNAVTFVKSFLNDHWQNRTSLLNCMSRRCQRQCLYNFNLSLIL